MTKNQLTEQHILIAEYDGKKFKPYNKNLSWDIEFSTYKSCEEYIKEKKLIDFIPQLGYQLGVGDYRNNFHDLMRVVEKICKEKFSDNETSYLRTFGMLNDSGEFMVRFNRGRLFEEKKLIDATFFAVVDFLQNNKRLCSD